MLSWKDYYAQEEVRQDRLAEAEHERLVKLLSRKKNPGEKKASVRLLESLGYNLVSWGDALLRRVSDRYLVR